MYKRQLDRTDSTYFCQCQVHLTFWTLAATTKSVSTGSLPKCTLRRAADVEVIVVIRQISGNEFMFQQDSAPAHCARETSSSYDDKTHWTLFHRNSGHWTVQILTRWTTKSGLQCSSASTRQRSEMLTNCDSVCRTFAAALNKTSSTHPLTSGVCDSKHAHIREATFWTHAVNLSA